MIVDVYQRRLEMSVRETIRLAEIIGFTNAVNKVSSKWGICKECLMEAYDEWCGAQRSERLIYRVMW